MLNRAVWLAIRYIKKIAYFGMFWHKRENPLLQEVFEYLIHIATFGTGYCMLEMQVVILRIRMIKLATLLRNIMPLHPVPG